MKLNLLHPSQVSPAALRTAAGRLNDGGGLALLPNYKGNAGQHRWTFRFTLAGKVAEMGLGTLAEVTLSAARDAAVANRQKVGRGEDPRAGRVAKREADAAAVEDARRARLGLPVAGSLKEWATNYAATKRATWAPATGVEFDQRMEFHVYPALGNVKVADLTRLQLTEFFRGIKGTAIMHSVRKLVNQVLNYAVDSEAIGKNPCEGIQRVLPKHVGSNNPAVRTAEALADVLAKFAAFPGGLAMRTAMMVQVYLFQRSDVTASMEWAHVNLSRGLWTIPGANMKRDAEGKANGGDHIVPLPRQIVRMLEALQAETGSGRFVFPNAARGDDHMTADAINNAMQSAMGKKRGGAWNAYQTAHGFRAVGISFGQEYCGLDKRVLDIVAGHAIGDNLGTAYERNEWHAERRPALQAFADWLDALQAGDASAALPLSERKAQAPARPAGIDADTWAAFLAFQSAQRAAGSRTVAAANEPASKAA